jgi:hypothetical protein
MPEPVPDYPFHRNGMKPRILDVSRVARTEGTRQVVAYLEAEGVLDGMRSWEALGVPDRETWVKAITEVFTMANREAAKAALAELAEYEELALLLACRRCGADEEEPCRDQRTRDIRHISHPHAERMDDMEAQL